MIDVSNLIRRRNAGLLVPRAKGEGYFDYANGGIWVEPETTYELIEAVVVPAQSDEIQFDEGGIHVNLYKKAYAYEPLEIGKKVKFKDQDYTVMEELDYSHYAAGLKVYFIKRADVDD